MSSCSQFLHLASSWCHSGESTLNPKPRTRLRRPACGASDAKHTLRANSPQSSNATTHTIHIHKYIYIYIKRKYYIHMYIYTYTHHIYIYTYLHTYTHTHISNGTKIRHRVYIKAHTSPSLKGVVGYRPYF